MPISTNIKSILETPTEFQPFQVNTTSPPHISKRAHFKIMSFEAYQIFLVIIHVLN